jgi:hypothetical protein
VVIDLQHRAEGVVPMLVLAAADLQQVVEGNTRLALSEGQHGFEVVGGQPDVDPWFRQFHGVASAFRFPRLA